MHLIFVMILNIHITDLIEPYNHFTMTTKMSQEAKKDEFRKYLEKAGVLELLTKSLVQLYEV